MCFSLVVNGATEEDLFGVSRAAAEGDLAASEYMVCRDC